MIVSIMNGLIRGKHLSLHFGLDILFCCPFQDIKHRRAHAGGEGKPSLKWLIPRMVISKNSSILPER